jgi:hypothetical protein
MPDTGTGEMRVRVHRRPGRGSGVNEGRTGRVVRECREPGAYEIRFDEPDHRNHDWDYMHGEDLVVTAMNGHEVTDDLTIPEFLLAKNRPSETKEERTERERVLQAARRGAETVSVRPTAAGNVRTPKGGVDPKFLAELQAENEKRAARRAVIAAEKRADRAAERRATRSAAPRMLTFRQGVLALRALDPVRWGRLTRAKLGPLLAKAGWPQRDGAYKFLAGEIPQLAALLGGGKVPPPARDAPAEGSGAPAESPGAARAAPAEPKTAPKAARGRALRGSQPVPPGMGKRARGR